MQEGQGQMGSMMQDCQKNMRSMRRQHEILKAEVESAKHWNYPEEPGLQRSIEAVITGLASSGFDPFVGRKLFTFAHKAGLDNIRVQVECYHLIAGEVDPNILKQWELKLEIAVPQVARILGSESAAKEQARRFIEYLRRPDTLTYSNVFTVTGKKRTKPDFN